jgi:hypothetical protein
MNLAKLLTTDNVVHLSTYRIARSLDKQLISYKNLFFRMNDEQRQVEKQAIETALLFNPFDLTARLKMGRIREVETND